MSRMARTAGIFAAAFALTTIWPSASRTEPEAQTFALADTKDLVLINVKADPVEYKGRKAVRLEKAGPDDRGGEERQGQKDRLPQQPRSGHSRSRQPEQPVGGRRRADVGSRPRPSRRPERRCRAIVRPSGRPPESASEGAPN